MSLKAQKKYDAKCKTLGVKYYPAEMQEVERLKKYLADTHQSANSYVKNLIKADLDKNGV